MRRMREILGLRSLRVKSKLSDPLRLPSYPEPRTAPTHDAIVAVERGLHKHSMEPMGTLAVVQQWPLFAGQPQT
jgi:hypothetical protein